MACENDSAYNALHYAVQNAFQEKLKKEGMGEALKCVFPLRSHRII